MATVDTLSRQDLFNKFDPECYVNMKIERLKNHGRIERVLSDWLYGVFSEGNVKGETLLDVGTGPVMKNAMYASSHFDKIYLSDFSRNNIAFLEEWRSGRHGEKLSPFIDEVVKREGNVQTPREKEMELRSKIQGVLHCDVLQENPLLGINQSVPRRFGAVTSSWCVNNAASTKAEFQQVLKNISSLIKPGGYLVLMGISSDMGGYEVNGVTFPSIVIKAEDVRSFFNTPFMTTLQLEIEDNVPYGSDNCCFYNVLARIL